MANLPFNDQVSTDAQKTQQAPKPTDVQRPSVLGELLDLSMDERKDFAKEVKKAVTAWEASGKHRENIKHWNELLEGVVEETDFPWEGCANINIPLIAIHLITLHSVISRSVTTVDPLWFGSSNDPQIREMLPDIEDMLNDRIKNHSNIVAATRDVIYNAGRDGIAWMMVTYEDEYERVNDVVYVESAEEFQAEFPDAESAGMSEEEYQKTLQEVASEASPENPKPIDFKADNLIYSGPKAEVIEESMMIRAPMTAKDIRGCRFYGNLFYSRKDELKKRVDEKQLWPDAVKALIESRKKGEQRRSEWMKSRDRIEGIGNHTTDYEDEFELIQGILKFAREKDGREEKYFITYSKTLGRCLGVSEFAFSRDIYIPFRLMRRPGRMLGFSIPELLEDINYEINASVNLDINSETIANVPIFKGLKSNTEGFDPQAEDNTIRPGVMFWLEKPEVFDVVNKQPYNGQFSTLRRQELIRYGEQLIGPTQMLSGRENAQDPKAPGNKTIALIQQSNMRIEDYINEFRGGPDYGFDGLGNTCLALIYRYGPNSIPFESRDEENQIKEMQRKFLRGDIKLTMHGVTVNLNPEVEFNKAMMEFEILSKIPQIGGNVKKLKILVDNLLVSGRIKNKKKISITDEEANTPPPPPPPPEPKVSLSLKADITAEEAIEFTNTGKITPPQAPPVAPPILPGAPTPIPSLNGVNQ